jgi:hypothetical protein
MPVAQVLGALVLLLLAVVGGLWRGFVWLDQRIASRIAGWAESKPFAAAVTQIVNEAFAATNDINNRMHEEHRRAFSESRDAIKRLHGRVDHLYEKVGEK